MAEYHYIGKERIVLQQDTGLSTTTGSKTWNAALVSIEWLKAQDDLSNKSVLDCSSGNGLVALASERLGAKETVATELDLCYQLLVSNIKANEGSSITPVQYKWGQVVSKVMQASSTGTYDVIILSDLLFIAFRDDIEPLLLDTLLQLAVSPAIQIVFVYEERLLDREDVPRQSVL